MFDAWDKAKLVPKYYLKVGFFQNISFKHKMSTETVGENKTYNIIISNEEKRECL